MFMTSDVPDNVQQQAEAIRQAAEDAYDRLRSRGDLTADAVRSAMAQVYLDTKTKLAALQESSDGQADAKRQAALRTAFGTSSSDPLVQMSARDAGDRCSQLGSDDWQTGVELLERAQLNNDGVLASALAYRAFELAQPDYSGTYSLTGWGAVMSSYLATRPGAASALATLATLAKVKPTIGSLAAFWAPTPHELAGVDDWRLQTLAAGA